MKEVARFRGKIIEMNPPPKESHVILTDLSNNKTIKTPVDYNFFVTNNLYNNDEFEIIINESGDNKTHPIIRKITKVPEQQDIDFNI